MAECDREGDFRGEILEYGLQEAESGAIGVRIKASLKELYDGENWHNWSQYEQEAWGSIWIVKKDGSTNESGVNALCKACGWDGNLGTISNGEWQPNPCQFNVKAEVYKGVTTHKVAFVNEYDRTPGGNLGNVSPDRLKQLQAKFGAPLRALAGAAKANSTTPAGKPPAPPKAKSLPEPKEVAAAATAKAGDDDIPF